VSAQIIPFDPHAPRRLPMDVQAAWDAFDAAAQRMQALRDDPNSTSSQRRDAMLRALTLQRAFVVASERL
jgi:hypothetical protein